MPLLSRCPGRQPRPPWARAPRAVDDLRIRRPVANGSTAGRALREEPYPVRRAKRIGRPHDRYPLTDHGEKRADHGSLGKVALVQVSPFDEEVWSARHASKTPDLRPERPVNERGVQPAHGLSLDGNAVRQAVVAVFEAALNDLEPRVAEQRRNPVKRLPVIDDDSADWRHDPGKSVRGCRPLGRPGTLS